MVLASNSQARGPAGGVDEVEEGVLIASGFVSLSPAA